MRILLMGAIPGLLLGMVFLVAQVRSCCAALHNISSRSSVSGHVESPLLRRRIYLKLV